MSNSAKVIVGLLLVTGAASIPIISNVAKRVGELPVPTPLNVPSALKNINQSDPTYASVSTTPHPKKSDYTLYYVALDDNGKLGRKIGCNDSLVPVIRQSDSIQPLTTQERLTQLFANKNQYSGKEALYNALYQSSLKLERFETRSDGTVYLYIVGTVQVSGSCDTPRIIEQITQVAKDGAKNKQAKVFLNDKPIQEVLSQK